MRNNYAPGFSYADFATSFRAEFFDSDFWADMIKKSGARLETAGLFIIDDTVTNS